MNECKQYLGVTIVLLVLLISGHFFLLIFIDPLNISMFEFSRDEFFIKEMRFQSASLINKYDFDSAIVGSSAAQNFKAKNANEKLGGTFLNLSPPGSLLEERKVVLEYFLTKKKVKTLIISIDGVSKIQRNQGIPLESWAFLYNDNHFDDLSLYANRKYFPYINCHSLFSNEIFVYLLGRCPRHKIREKIEDLTEWQSDPFHNGRFGGIESWRKHQKNFQVERSISEIRTASQKLQTKRNTPVSEEEKWYEPTEFSKNILPLIKRYPDTRFILFFPPYSIYQFAIDVQTRPYFFAQYKDLVEKVVLETEGFSNAEVYWFNDQDFITNIANYKDLTHHHAKLNSMFLDHFRDRRSIIHARNCQSRIKDLEEKANKVDLIALSNKFL